MWYLEDYLDKLEWLPGELRNELSKMREMDLCAENSMDNIKKDVDTLFSKANIKDSNKLETEFQAIMKQGEKPIKQCEEKLQLANHVQELLKKYLNQLDHGINELAKNLEVNNYGCSVSQLIKKDMNAASNELNCSKQKSAIAASSCSTGFAVQSSNCFNSQVVSRSSDLAAEAESQTVLVSQQFSQMNQAADLEVDNNVALTNNMNSASCVLPLEIQSNKIFAGSSQIISNSTNKTKEYGKLKKTRNSITSIKKNRSVKLVGQDELYCICNQVSYGTMVACDRKMCLHKWFHFKCVGLMRRPRGKWYCPQCTNEMKIQKLCKQ